MCYYISTKKLKNFNMIMEMSTIQTPDDRSTHNNEQKHTECENVTHAFKEYKVAKKI